MIDFEKMNIEHGKGFIEWKKQQLQWMDKLSSKEGEKVLHRITILRKWATDHNLMKPRFLRLKDERFFGNLTKC